MRCTGSLSFKVYLCYLKTQFLSFLRLRILHNIKGKIKAAGIETGALHGEPHRSGVVEYRGEVDHVYVSYINIKLAGRVMLYILTY